MSQLTKVLEDLSEAEASRDLTIDWYQENANRTAAPPTKEVAQRLNAAGFQWAEILDSIIDLGKFGDDTKRFTFYNKIKSADYEPRHQHLLDADDPLLSQKLDILHALLGVITEAGEMAEAIFLREDEGKLKEIWDMINIMEEGGDGAWYIGLLARGTRVPLAVALLRNIKKLRQRFPNAFTEADAVNRNLEAERKTLEG